MIRKIVLVVGLLGCMLTTVNAKDSKDFKDSLIAKFRITGRLHLDAGAYNNQPSGVFNSVNITDLRIGARATISENWSGVFYVGFANNKVSVKDAYMQYKRKNSYFRAGNILGPFGISQLTSSNDLVFNTGANIAETLFGGRKMGLLYTYSVPNHNLSAGMFYGTSISSLSDANGGGNYNLRYVFRNQRDKQHLIHIGASGSYRTPGTLQSADPDDSKTTVKRISLASKGVTYLKAPTFIGAVIDDASHQSMLGLEAMWIQRRCYMQAEYIHSWIGSPTLSADYQVKGGYVQFSYLIKGENYGYSTVGAVPTMPTDKNSIMLSVRGNITQLNDNVTQLNGDQLRGGCQKDIGIGLGYYANKYISGRLNYSYIWLDQYSQLGKQKFGMLQARVQLCF